MRLVLTITKLGRDSYEYVLTGADDGREVWRVIGGADLRLKLVQDFTDNGYIIAEVQDV